MKLLIRAPNWVGDAVMCLPALGAVRSHWPQADIAILARPWVAELYRGQAVADRIIVLDSAGNSPLGLEKAARNLRNETFDAALLLQNAFSAAWLAWRARIRERIGYARDGRSLLLTRAVAVPKKGEIPAHEVFYYLNLLKQIGWLPELPRDVLIELQIAPAAKQAAENRLLQAGARADAIRVALAPGAAFGSAKCWLPERFASLADGLIEDFAADVIIFGTASEQEVSRQIISRMKYRPITLVGQTSIAELPALFSRCRVFVGNDSGAMHVAAAAGLPVVAIFGPTDPEGTAAMTPLRTIVQHKVSCSPCFLRECPIDHPCMNGIEVTDVRDAAGRWLSQLRVEQPSRG